MGGGVSTGWSAISTLLVREPKGAGSAVFARGGMMMAPACRPPAFACSAEHASCKLLAELVLASLFLFSAPEYVKRSLKTMIREMKKREKC